jgi:hypothetical protein
LYLFGGDGRFFLVETAVAVDHLFAGGGGDAVAGDDDTCEVNWVGGGYGDDGRTVAVPGRAEGVDCLRKGELLAAKAGDEAASANLSSGFESAQNAEKVAPAGSVGLACEKVADEDAVAGQQDAGGGLQRGVGAAGLFDCSRSGVDFFGEEAPAACGAAGGALAGGVGRARFATWVHHGAELIEAVGGNETGGGEFPEGVLGLLF